jgi:hypothetical protein
MHIEQEASYTGPARWRWAVWIEGAEADLDAIDHVEYTLHPTFRNPLREVRGRRTKFRLRSSGWGEFEINAQLFMKNGDVVHLRHWLTLTGPEGQAPSKQPPRPTVLVSHAAADAGWAQAITDTLSRFGFDALMTDDTFELGQPWQASIGTALDNSQLMIGVFSENPSPWVEREVSEALARQVEVVPFAVGREPVVPDWLRDRSVVDVTSPSKLEPAINMLAERRRS